MGSDASNYACAALKGLCRCATAVGLRWECPAASAIVLANAPHIKRESRA